MRKLVWMGCILYLLIGLAHVVIGAIMPELLAHYDKEYTDGGLLIFLQFGGFLVGVLTMPNWSRRLGSRSTLLVALISLFIGQVMYSLLLPWHWMLVGGVLAGSGFGMIEAIIGAMIIQYVKEKKAVAMSKLEVFFGIGALVMPMIAGYLMLQGYWQLSFPLIAGYTLISAIVWMTLNFDEIEHLLARKSSSNNPGDEPEKPKYPKNRLLILYCFAAFFTLYVGIEMSFVNFLPSMMIESIGVTSATASLSVTVFWSTMIVGRLFAGYIAEKIQYSRYLLISTIGSIVFLFLMAFTASFWSTYLMILFLGLFMSGVFGIALVFANHILPGMTTRTTSILVASGGIGGAVIPLITGLSMDAFNVQSTMLILAAGSLLLFAVLMVAIRRDQKLKV